ncbi:aminoglycoside phosphotransferase [Sorangium cellulosum]|uniref:Aminoglycoside phosphotransferase n=1 Tax=Sorangium cellulosum TaxID=56 RepID=A0A2L0EQR6_SORCE|nr:aminoglycoside phosphotransferase family protein [Sorangium cellulosum]AUX41651.1 aminoglycoside phosphotransferase [Sorangium cellulosum]
MEGAAVVYERDGHRMELITIERGPDSARRSLTADQILALCRRVFGERVAVTSARELGGGTFNTTYLVALANQRVVLRVAPPPGADLSWDEAALMRRELHIQPYFAALAARMPRILAADFTHQLIDRDYMFQTYLPGERWDHAADALSPEEAGALWEQFGLVARTIHDTVGAAFGGPHPAPEFPAWSGAVLYRLERSLETMAGARLDVTDMAAALEVVREHTAVLDEIREPRLMHGDLWLFNLLIERGPGGASIVGVLDADRAFWGDPMADWTVFVLSKSASPDTRPLYDRFWQAYGRPEPTRESVFRAAVYEAMNVGIALPWAARHGHDDMVLRGKRELREALEALLRLRR